MRTQKIQNEEQMKVIMVSHLNYIMGESIGSNYYWNTLIQCVVQIKFGQNSTELSQKFDSKQIKSRVFDYLQRHMGMYQFSIF